METQRTGLPGIVGVAVVLAAVGTSAWGWSCVPLGPVQTLTVPAAKAEEPFRVSELSFQVLPPVRGELSLAEGPNWLEFSPVRVDAAPELTLRLEAAPLVPMLGMTEAWRLASDAPMNAGPLLIASARP